MITVSEKNSYTMADSGKAYRVISGTVWVIVRALASGVEQHRACLMEANENDLIPGFCFETDFHDMHFLIEPVLSSNSPAQIEEIENTEAIRFSFAERAFPDCDYNQEFKHIVDEWFERELDRTKINIEGAKSASETAVQRTMYSFVSLFAKDKSGRASKTQPTPNALYDAIARVCDWQSIDHISYQDIYKEFKDDFKIEDVARVSGFVTRDIILEYGWQKKDIGPVLAYIGEKHIPAALLPIERKPGYYIWRSDTLEQKELTDAAVGLIDPRAVMFYRTFPCKSMGLKDLFGFALKDLRIADVIIICLMILFETLVGILLPTMNEEIYDTFIPLADSSGLLGMCYVIIACNLGSVAFGLVKGFTNYRCFNRMKYSVQAATFDRLFNLPDSFFRKYESAELAQKAFGVGEIFDLLSKAVFLSGFSAIFSLFYLSEMNGYSEKMTEAGIIALLICVILILLLGVLKLKRQRQNKEPSNKKSSILYQLITAIDKLRIAGAEDRGLAQYFDIYKDTAVIEKKIEGIDNWNNIINTAMTTVSSIVFYYLMIRKDMGLSMGSFMAFTSAFGSFSAAVMQLVNSCLEASAIVPDYQQLRPLLEAVPETDTTAALPGEITGAIEVNDVSFAYEGDKYILRNFKLSIASGEYIGVVGSSGCGKSTLLKLLLGFETPQLGKIYYDSKDIESVNKRELRKQFGVVLQNGDTISGSIYDNITITDPTVSMDDVQQAIKDAGLEEDIANMPMGLNTILSEGGGGVSGGQKQRILIARALVSKPKVLFFDEATSALDNRTQQQICESIEKLKCTKFIIAHRLTTIMNCDRIIVMDAGQIVEQGTYDQLMEQEGIFYQLAKRQMM